MSPGIRTSIKLGTFMENLMESNKIHDNKLWFPLFEEEPSIFKLS
jgi:hypothetical protein